MSVAGSYSLVGGKAGYCWSQVRSQAEMTCAWDGMLSRLTYKNLNILPLGPLA